MFTDFQVAHLRRHCKVREARTLSPVRQVVGFLLSRSARYIPHAAGMSVFDATELVEYGKAEDERLGKTGRKLTQRELLRRAVHRNFSAFFLKALAHTMHHVPCLNAFIDYAPFKNGGKLYLSEDINLSFTVHTKFGVVKPVIRNPHLKTLEEVADEMRTLTRKARRTDIDQLYFRCAETFIGVSLKQLDFSGIPALWSYLREKWIRGVKPDPQFANVSPEDQLTVNDVLGATCTVANIGMMGHGHQTVTCIIPPEVSMWGIGDLHLAPAVVDGEVVPRYHITIVLTIDHRALDGGDVFPFRAVMNKYLREPALLYNWKPGDDI